MITSKYNFSVSDILVKIWILEKKMRILDTVNLK